MQDKDIIELFWQRDERAISETNQKYGKYCHRIAENILENAQDADECVNDTWMKTWKAIPTSRPQHFQGFLAKITRNLAVDRWKHESAAKRGNGVARLALDELEECVSGLSNVEVEYEAKELAGAIDIFISALPQKEQRIFVWRYFYMESIPDIAKLLDVKANYVSVVLSRTRNKLKQYLQEEGYEL